MSVGGINPSLLSAIRALQGIQSSGRVARKSPAELPNTEKNAIRAGFQSVFKLRKSLETLQDVLLGGGSGVAATISSPSLGLSTAETAATLTSGAEVNTTTASSFSSDAMSFSGTSTSTASISGTYTGGSDSTWTFEVTNSGTVGSDFAQVRLLIDGTSVGSITFFFGFTPAGTTYTLPNGLRVEFSGGELDFGDSFSLNLTPDEAVDPDAAFNASPNLDGGESVVAGTFEVNGTSIAVDASDSLNGVLGKINASAAGVTATYDAANDKVVLTQDTTGSAPSITVGNDTTGFLSAFKLDSGVLVAGTDGEIDQPMSGVAPLSGVSTGTVIINGVTVNLDVTTDSLNDVVNAINSAATGATASITNAGQSVTLTSDDVTEDLVLDDGTSGLFTALGITPKSYKGGGAAVNVQKASESFEAFGESIRAIFDEDLVSQTKISAFSTVRRDLKTFILRAARLDDDEDEHFSTAFGLDFDFRKDIDRDVMLLDDAQKKRFRSAAEAGDRDLFRFFTKNLPKGSENLLQVLIKRLKKAEKDIRSGYGSIGLLLSVKS